MVELNKIETKKELSNYILEIERLGTQKNNIQDEIKETFESAANKGFDVKAMKEIIKLRKQDAQKVVHEEEIRELYKEILLEI